MFDFSNMFDYIEMQYPYDYRNSNYDGNIHRIKPMTLEELENGCYRLTYTDISLKKTVMITMLKKENGSFVKVPLVDYDKFRKMKAVRKIPVSELGSKIGCDGKFRNIEDMIPQTKAAIQYRVYESFNGKYKLENPGLCMELFGHDRGWVTEEEISIAKEKGIFPEFVLQTKAAVQY